MDEKKRGELLNQLSNSITLRNQEHNIWVTTLFLSLTTSSLLLVALFNDGQLPKNSSIGVLITIFGSIITLFLLIVQQRALTTAKAYEEFSKKIEGDLKLREYSYNNFRDNFSSKFKGTGRFIIELFNYGLLIGWCVFFIFFIVKVIHENNYLIQKGVHDYQLLIIGALLGAVIGYLISLLHGWTIRYFKKRQISKVCSSYEGIYLAYEKYDKNEEPKYYFELNRNGSRFIIRNGIAITGHEDYYTEITMNEPSYKRGQGYYQHHKSLDGATRFGFLEIQLAKNEILVHVTIHKGGVENSDAYRWVKQDYALKEDLERKYRDIQQINLKEKFKDYLQK